MGNLLPNGLLPLLNPQSAADSMPGGSYRQPMNMPRRAQMARLIQNPDQTDGAPPYALTDQTGTVQRYVEPVDGIDLSSHVGQIVTVRHDTGSTLLASQLELPPQALRPMTGNPDGDRYAAATNPAGAWRRTADSANMVQQVQYVDNDDASVQLLPDDVSITDPGGAAQGGLMPLDGMAPSGSFPPFAEQVGPPVMGGPVYGQPYGPMQNFPGMMADPNQMMGPCPNCGRYHNGMGNGPNGGDGVMGNDCQSDQVQLTADVELNWLRPQIAESSIGNLSDEYQFSPRIILVWSGLGNLDGRVRYWRYDHNSDVVGTSDDVRINFDVLDIEALHKFAAGRSQLTLSAGVRMAGIHLRDTADEKCGTDLLGLTLAGDGLTPLGNFPGGHFGLVYGGRLSILAGGWGGDPGAFVDQHVRGDNVLVDELYAGVELVRRFHAADIHARLLFEMQNWKSDVLAQDAGIESIGFFGPGAQIGAEF